MTKESILALASSTIYTYKEISCICKQFDLSEKDANNIIVMAMRCGIKFDELESLLWKVSNKWI